MLVKLKGPVRGKRELIAIGDEATVNRIHRPGSRYDGMVERLQEVLPETSENQAPSNFRLELNENIPAIGFQQYTPSYHIMKFFALRLGSSLADYFSTVLELRFFSTKKRNFAATYSHFVSDTTSVIERRSKASKEYYKILANSRENAQTFREHVNACELRYTPALAAAIEKLEKTGVIVIHPEANYHVDENGDIKFFELSKINVSKVLRAAEQMKNRLEVIAKIAALIALLAKINAYKTLHSADIDNSWLSGYFKKFLAASFEDCVKALLLNPEILTEMVYKIWYMRIDINSAKHADKYKLDFIQFQLPVELFDPNNPFSIYPQSHVP